LCSGEFAGNPLDLTLSRVVPDNGTIGDSTTDHFGINLPCVEQAIPPRGHSESGKSELLGGKLSFYSIEVTLPLKFTVDPDA
jgi:hypothetical protein